MSTTDGQDETATPRRVRDVAIVGMACVMPGAGDVEAFWANIVDGVDSVTEVPPSRWNQAAHYDPDHDSSRRDAGRDPMSVSKWGGFVPDVGFDALSWGIPPASLSSIDPAQLMALKVAAGALDDAGYGEGGFDRDRASVVIATGSGGASDLPAGFLLRLLLRTHGVPFESLPPELDAFLPELTEDGLPGVLTSVIAGRVANRLDLGGKNLTVDSACASVLVGLDIACNELTAGSSDLVLLGAVDLHNGAQDYVSFSAAQALSRQGRCRSFDADADGMTLAEGAGCLVLKRLADAERDGDRIYAVVKAVAGSSDGRHLGLTAPRQEGQVKAVRRTYAESGMSPTEVGLVEAHGTGTPTGDRIELGTTTQVFTEAGAAPGTVVLGSVKSNIGHIKCAAGIASLIKAARSAYHGVLPPTLHIDRPNAAWDADTSPFVFLDRSRPWLDDRRVVAVSGFGFGGTNFHAVLENHRPAATEDGPPLRMPDSGRHHWPAELFAFRGASDDEIGARLDELAARLDDELGPPLQADRMRLRDVAASVSAAGEGPVRLALVARDLAELAAKVGAARTGEQVAGAHRRGSEHRQDGAPVAPRVAFLFADATAARPWMAADVLVAFPRLRTAARAGRRLAESLWPARSFGDSEPEVRAEAVGPGVAVAGLTLSGVLVALGVRPDHAVGAGQPWPPSPDSPADLVDEVRRLHADGVRVFVEVGPTQGLTDLVDRALGDQPHTAVATDRPGEHGLTTLVDALARLAVAGVPVDLAALHAGRDSRPERWEAPPRRPGWIVNGHFVRTAAGEPLPRGLRPAGEAPVIRLADPAGAAASPASVAAPVAAPGGAAPGEVAVVAEYLRILEGVIATGGDIIRGHATTAGDR
jgi:acyl transferase domain-containing protein